MKKFIIILALFFVGCATPHDTTLERERAEAVTVADLVSHAAVLEKHHWKYSQDNGIVWPPWRSSPDLENPDQYKNGGDSALFTGYVLASSVYKYKVTKNRLDLNGVMVTLRGVYILTHATGTPGVIARCAFPASNPDPWGYPNGGSWLRRIPTGFVGTGPEHFPPGDGWFNYMTHHPEMVYYTRATRDQLTGLLFGLSVAWHELQGAQEHQEEIEDIKSVIKVVVHDLYSHLRAHDFLIRDENGKNNTSADDVTGIMKLQLLALYRLTAPEEKKERITEKYLKQFKTSMFLDRKWEFWNIFNNYSQYYAWNLRYARAYSIWSLEDDSDRRKTISNYIRDGLWAYTKNHGCPFFTYLYAATVDDAPKRGLDSALLGLKSLSLRPIRQYPSPLCGDIRMPNILQVIFGSDSQYHILPHLRKPTDYFTWTKRGWDSGHCHEGVPQGDNTGIDFTLPYWLGRHLNLVPAK